MLTHAEYAEALGWFLLLPPIHHWNLGFQGHVTAKTTDRFVLRDTHAQATNVKNDIVSSSMETNWSKMDEEENDSLLQ